MAHWLIDPLAAQPLPFWLEAFPQGRLLQRGECAALPDETPGVLWCRCRPGDALDSVFGSLALNVGQSVVVLADQPDDSVVAEALALGASGCCNAHAAPEVLRQVALVVENGGLWIGQSLLRRLVGSTTKSLAGRSAVKSDDWSSRLSERETQVARLVAGGASNREIAEALSITERTVKAHLSAIFEKLGLRDRLQLSLRINGVNV